MWKEICDGSKHEIIKTTSIFYSQYSKGSTRTPVERVVRLDTSVKCSTDEM